jgi:TolB protein
MKIFIYFFIFSFQLSIFAQDAVIAVGQAEQDKDKFVLDEPELYDLSGDQKRLSAELIDILKNDFAFYKHKFNTVDYPEKGKKSHTQPELEKWHSGGITYFVATRVDDSSGPKIKINVKVWSVLGKKQIFTDEYEISKESLRPVAHKIADAIYQSITGKPSIFLTKIFFLSDRTSGKDIEKELYIMDFDGRRVDKLTSFNSVILSPAISSDNSKMIFSLIASKKEISRSRVKIIKNIDLKLLDLKTRKMTTISDKPGINSGAVFSADNNTIYLTLSFGGNADIYEMNLSSGKMKKVTSHFGDDVDPSITRDGSLMAFLSNRSGRANIFTMTPTDTEKNVKRISFVGQFNAAPRFSPDGQNIVFSSWVNNGFDLFRMRADGNNLVRLTKDFGSNEEPSFSADGEFIIFSSKKLINRRQSVQNVYIMNKEGDILGQLTEDFGHCFSPKWTN